MKNVTLIGASDLALHMASYLKQDEYNIVGLFDDFTPSGKEVEGYTILGGIKDIPLFKDKMDGVFIGIGYKHLKEKAKISEYLFEHNIKLETFIHKSVYIDNSSVIKNGVFILPNCSVDKNVIIGRNVFFNLNCSIAHDTAIGSESFFGAGVILSGKTKVGKRCFLGSGTVLRDNTLICDDVVLGAGSVVVDDITEPGVYYGVPARKKKTLL